jgi:hypothetical protein
MVARRGRPPADAGKAPLPCGRKWNWGVIRALDRVGPWTIRDIRARSNDRAETIGAFVERLELGGVAVRVTSPYRTNANAYRLASSPSAVPRIRADGSTAPPSAQAHMWSAIRRLGQFSRLELILAASTDEVAISAQAAARFLWRLTRAGYLIRVGGRSPVWRLKPGMNTGPEPPRLSASGAAFDRNRNAVLDKSEASS